MVLFFLFWQFNSTRLIWDRNVVLSLIIIIDRNNMLWLSKKIRQEASLPLIERLRLEQDGWGSHYVRACLAYLSDRHSNITYLALGANSLEIGKLSENEINFKMVPGVFLLARYKIPLFLLSSIPIRPGYKHIKFAYKSMAYLWVSVMRHDLSPATS